MYGACGCGAARGHWTGPGEAAGPSPPLPLLPVPSPNRFGQVLRLPARTGRGRVCACEPVCLVLINKPGLLLHRSPAHTCAPPSASLPAAACRFRVDSVGPGNWDSPVCSRLGLGEGPSPGRVWEPGGKAGAGVQRTAGPGGGGLQGGGEPTGVRACVGTRAGKIRSFLRPPPESLLPRPLCLPPGPPPASRRECPLLSSAERVLPELHFWDSSPLLSLALCQLPLASLTANG